MQVLRSSLLTLQVVHLSNKNVAFGILEISLIENNNQFLYNLCDNFTIFIKNLIYNTLVWSSENIIGTKKKH